MNEADSRRSLRPSAIVETVALSEGGIMIVDLQSGRCWQLNPVGAETWELLQSGAPMASIVETLSARYGVGSAVIATDVQRLVDDLTREGLLLSGADPVGPR